MYLCILVLFALWLPFNIVAVMHLKGWEWWSALIAVLIFSVIPVVGQFGYVILGFVGAYFLYQADFNWSKAAYNIPETFSVRTLTPDRFKAFKDTTLVPQF